MKSGGETLANWLTLPDPKAPGATQPGPKLPALSTVLLAVFVACAELFDELVLRHDAEGIHFLPLLTQATPAATRKPEKDASHVLLDLELLRDLRQGDKDFVVTEASGNEIPIYDRRQLKKKKRR